MSIDQIGKIQLVTNTSKDMNIIEFDRLCTDEISLGHDSTNTIRLDNRKFAMVSKWHLKIRKMESGLFSVTDLDSLNGVYLNDKRIFQEHQLRSGDCIELGLYGPKFTFVLVG